MEQHQQQYSAEPGVVARRQSGASAIEFAFVLPLLIALTYSLIVYSYSFVVYESLSYAAQQGAEAAVAVDPSDTDAYQDNVTAYVRSTVAGVLGWMPQAQRNAAIGANGAGVQPVFCDPAGAGGSPYCPQTPTGGQPIVIKLQFPLTQFFPVLTMPGIGSIPPLPTTITGVGVAVLPGG